MKKPVRFILHEYAPPKDKLGYVWAVVDQYKLENWRIFHKREDAEKYYNSLNLDHPIVFTQFKVE